MSKGISNAYYNNKYTIRNSLSIFFLFSLTFLTISCNSSGLHNIDETEETLTNDPKKRITNLESSMSNLKFQLKNLAQEYEISKKILSSLQNDMQSQNEELATQRKNIDILKRGLRSGLFEELPDDTTINPIKNNNSTMLPDFTNGRSSFTDRANFLNSVSSGKTLNTNDPIGPKQLLASAEIKIRKAEYKKGLVELEELKKKFPNFDDGGRSFLLSAEAWVKLKEYENVLPEIRSFYLKYPTSAELAYAKLLEGQAYEGNGSFEKAATLYNEVISLSPQSTLAQSARNGMLRMSDQK